MKPDLLVRRETRFVLWRPAFDDPPPTLLVGELPRRVADGLRGFREIPLVRADAFPELWEVAASACGLVSGRVYLYWFRVRDASVYAAQRRILYCTDPLAGCVDRRFLAPRPDEPDGAESGDPASVVLYRDGRLVPSDPEGQTADWNDEPPLAALPPNHRLVIYELPTRWCAIGSDGERSVGTGTFEDARALVDSEASSPSFPGLTALMPGRAHLTALGVNALELLPPADSDDDLSWGYGTANYFAADFNLGRVAEGPPRATAALAGLVKACHRAGIRFFTDMVMAFSRNNPYHNVNFLDYYVQWRGLGDPARDPEQGDRDGFGGDLFKYNYWVEGYHPLTGSRDAFVPAREYMKLQAAHWIEQFRVDGLRLDSVNNTGSYDFLQDFKDFARAFWRNLHAERVRQAERLALEERFLVVGEELSVPLALVSQHRLDGLWNERFKQILRQVVLGRPAFGMSFEESVRALIDARLLGFADTTQVANYVTSHDVGGAGNERLYNYLLNNGIKSGVDSGVHGGASSGVSDLERRIKLAFSCLLTAVGIPLILAGDEFADQHDLDISQEHAGAKQVDPVNYARMEEPWRRRVFDHVARLVRLRTRRHALAVNDTVFLHADFTDGRRVLSWQRGAGEDIVVVIANFSDWGTERPEDPASEYRVPGFPAAPEGRRWREITKDRAVPAEWAGREPVYPWEAKVYALEAG